MRVYEVRGGWVVVCFAVATHSERKLRSVPLNLSVLEESGGRVMGYSKGSQSSVAYSPPLNMFHELQAALHPNKFK
jgi:hypothetical protein